VIIGEYYEAERIFREALKMWQETGDNSPEAYIMAALGE